MIRQSDLDEVLHKQPFQPFRLHLHDGRCLDVLHKQLAIVGKTYVHIGITAPGQTEPIMETFETIYLDDVARLEFLPASSSSLTA